jgi:hypothetical protein
MKIIITTVIAVGVITGVAGYLGGRMPAHYPVSPDAQSFSEDKQMKLERIFRVRSTKNTDALSRAERKTLSQSQGYSKMEREIQYPDAKRITLESGNAKDTVSERILKLSATEIPVNNREKAAVTLNDHPAQAEVKQLLQEEEVVAKQNPQSSPTLIALKTSEDKRGTVAKAQDSVEKSSDNKYARTEPNIEGNAISGQQVIESNSNQVTSRSSFNYEKNLKTTTQEVIPLPSPLVSSKCQPQIVVLPFSSKGKSEKKKVKVVIDYRPPMGSLTYGNLNSLRNKLSNK